MEKITSDLYQKIIIPSSVGYEIAGSWCVQIILKNENIYCRIAKVPLRYAHSHQMPSHRTRMYTYGRITDAQVTYANAHMTHAKCAHMRSDANACTRIAWAPIACARIPCECALNGHERLAHNACEWAQTIETVTIRFFNSCFVMACLHVNDDYAY